MRGRAGKRNINFRQTKSERSATRSYKSFGTHFKEVKRKLSFST